jgi:ubiquinone/menaquinone biosynthesis C-methylase UbiE
MFLLGSLLFSPITSAMLFLLAGIAFSLWLLKKICRPNDKNSQWNPNSHEYKTEKLYNSGLTGEHNYHDGYLNFGLWDNTTDYKVAARQLVRKIGDDCHLTKDSLLLDVACGMGVQDIYLQQTYGCTITAADLSYKHVEIAKQKLKKSGVDPERIAYYNFSATKIPFADYTFSNVTCVEGGPHMNTRLDFLREAHRVLQKGGRLCISDILLKKEKLTLVQRFVRKVAEYTWCAPKANSYTPEKLIEHMRTIGFEDVKIEDISSRVMPGYYFDQRKLATMRECAKVRGWFYTLLGHVIDYVFYQTYKQNVGCYVIVTARKSTE